MPFKLGEKIGMLKSYKIFKDEYISKHIDMELLEQIDNWKDKRNKLVHGLVESTYGTEAVKQVALEGKTLIRKFASKTTLVTRYLDKQTI